MAGRRSRETGRLPAIHSRELRVAERLGVHAEADVGSGGVRGDVELVDLQGIEPEVIVMRLAGRRAWSAVAGRAEIRAALQRTRGQQVFVRIPGAGGQRGEARREVVQEPVPPA